MLVYLNSDSLQEDGLVQDGSALSSTFPQFDLLVSHSQRGFWVLERGPGTLISENTGVYLNCNEELKTIYSSEKVNLYFFSRAQVHFRGSAPHHPSPSSP